MMDNSYFTLCKYKDFKMFGNFIKDNNGNDLIEDIFIVDAEIKKVIFKEYNIRMYYNNMEYANLKQIGIKVLKALQFIKESSILEHTQKTLEIKRICDSALIKRKSYPLLTYYEQENYKIMMEQEKSLAEKNKKKYNEKIEKYINEIEKYGYKVIIGSYSNLILNTKKDITEDKYLSIEKLLKDNKELYKKYVKFEIENYEKKKEFEGFEKIIQKIKKDLTEQQ